MGGASLEVVIVHGILGTSHNREERKEEGKWEGREENGKGKRMGRGKGKEERGNKMEREIRGIFITARSLTGWSTH